MKTDNWSPSCSQTPVGSLSPGSWVLTSVWEGEQVQTQVRGWSLLLPLRLISCSRHWDPAAPDKNVTSSLYRLLPNATIVSLLGVGGVFWSIIHNFFNLSIFLYSFPIQLFSLTFFFFHHLPCFRYSSSPSCYIPRICGQLPAGSTNCQ